MALRLSSGSAGTLTCSTLLSSASRGKKLLGGVLLILGVSVLTGLDKVVETWAVDWIPAWVFAF